jgi:hypothetical protein
VSSEGNVAYGYAMNFLVRVEVEILLFLNSPMYGEVSNCLHGLVALLLVPTEEGDVDGN